MHACVKLSLILVMVTVFHGAGLADTASTDSAMTGPGTITFPSQDSLSVTADLYLAHADLDTPFIVLFHQASWSRGEYREIAPRLNELGFNCMAVDQRSGSEINDVVNETHARAVAEDKSTDYVDALPDMIAALEYAREHHATGKVLAWGSSYSAALVLKLGGDHPELADGVLSFAPGEYFERAGRSATWIQDSASKLQCPVFVTSARSEFDSWKSIYEAIPSADKTKFVPETDGNHGSRALWKQFEDSAAYWAALEPFLTGHFLE